MAQSGGFTLVEMAVVMVIIGLLMTSVLPSLTSARQTAQTLTAENNLKTIMNAVAAYVQANGCLPCPSTVTAVRNGFGRVRGDTNNAACGVCANGLGVPPFVSLGLPASSAHDGWGHWISMHVDTSLTVNFGVVPPMAACTAADVTSGQCTTVGASQKGLCRSGLSTANRLTVTNLAGSSQQAAVVLVSHGRVGAGSFIAGGRGSEDNAQMELPAVACSAGGGFERCNADRDRSYIVAPVVEGGADPFDDVLMYLDRNALVAQFGTGSCQTVW